MNSASNKIKWSSPSNIALVKYWGKHGLQLPNNASLSMTLNNAVTTTELVYLPSDDGLELHYYFEGERKQDFEEKVIAYFERLKSEFPFLDNYLYKIYSENSFPHSTGIASSASSMSAIALCLVKMEEQILGKQLERDAFFKRVSHIARLGSGSASRSVYGGWTTWGTIDDYPSTSDFHASEIPVKINPVFDKMGDAVLLVSSKKKSVSSTLGHKLMKAHPFAAARYEQANDNVHALICSMELGDFDTFVSIVENEALTLHSLLMTSSPDGMLVQPNSLEIINAVRKFRKETGAKVCFTLDAGPNVHLLYAWEDRNRVVDFVEKVLKAFCENGKWIDDRTGMGPKQLI